MGGLGQTEAIHDTRVVHEPTGPYHRAFKWNEPGLAWL